MLTKATKVWHNISGAHLSLGLAFLAQYLCCSFVPWVGFPGGLGSVTLNSVESVLIRAQLVLMLLLIHGQHLGDSSQALLLVSLQGCLIMGVYYLHRSLESDIFQSFLACALASNPSALM